MLTRSITYITTLGHVTTKFAMTFPTYDPVSAISNRIPPVPTP